MSETLPVTFTVTGLDRVDGCGRLIALAIVTLDVGGVELVLQGLGVRRGGGVLSVRAPLWRDPRSGRWVAAVLLPPELQAAIGTEVLAMLGGAAAA